MKTKNKVVAVALVAVLMRGAGAQEFSTQPWVGRSASLPSYPARSDLRVAAQPSYWVERDPRYRLGISQTQQVRYVTAPTVAANYPPTLYPGNPSGCTLPTGSTQAVNSYRPQWNTLQQPTPICPNCPYGGTQVGYRPEYRYAPAPLPTQMPAGFYRGDGLYGQDAVFAQGQPIRNFFRSLTP